MAFSELLKRGAQAISVFPSLRVCPPASRHRPEPQSVRESIEEQLVRLNRHRNRIAHPSSGGPQTSRPPGVMVEVPDLVDQ